jgi:shikimate dehydrogenase
VASNTPQLDHPAVLGVAGLPDVVANSLSPRMMRAVFEAWAIDAHYVPLAIEAADAASALRSIAQLGFLGCNVTMPFKPIAAQVADTCSDTVRHAGVANTLLVRADGSIHAEATDGVAVVEALRDRSVQLEGAHIILLGAGGAATEAGIALAEAGVGRIDIWNRTRARADRLAGILQDFAPALELEVHERMPIRDPAHVIVGCVPPDSIDPEALATLHEGTLVVDFAYRRDGGPTPLLGATRDRAQRHVDGRELLVRQGVAALRVWFGVEPPIEVMFRAVR